MRDAHVYGRQSLTYIFEIDVVILNVARYVMRHYHPHSHTPLHLHIFATL